MAPPRVLSEHTTLCLFILMLFKVVLSAWWEGKGREGKRDCNP
jgi:hypothetical protein